MTFVDDQKNTIASQLVDRLRKAIVSGELQPATKINLEHVRHSLDVSLSPLREALARLIADGPVEFQDNRGYWVAPVSLDNLEEVTRLRVEFETYALRQVMQNSDLSWESDLMRALHRLNRSEHVAGRPETLVHWEAAHREFHLTLIADCNSDVNAEHSEIAQGAVARAIDFACGRLQDHLCRTGNNLRAHLAANPGFIVSGGAVRD